MIVRVQTGTSFKGAGLYLLHDKRQEGEAERLTTDRVPWTFALNTLEQQPWQVIAEMQQTCRNQDMLKVMHAREQGRAPRFDGRPTEKPVMTVSLSWSPDQQQPDKAGMIRAAQDYLKEMKWDGLEALIIPHTDAKHSHLHILLCRVDPVTGKTQDDAWRNHRSLQWAREYDGREGFFLERREVKYTRGADIGPEMTRREWQEWKRLGQSINNSGALYEAGLKSAEWDTLKGAQRDERKAYARETNAMRADLRNEVRETVQREFAPQWEAYSAQRDKAELAQKKRDAETRRAIGHLRQAGHGASSEGIARLQAAQADQYKAMKAELYELRAPIIEAETARRAALAKPALAKLDQERAATYAALLAEQRGEKAELKQDQAAGKRRPDLLQKQHDAAGMLADASQPRPAPAQPSERQADRPGAQFGLVTQPYQGKPRPAFGMNRAEATRRAHAHGTSPQFPADRPQQPAPRPERTAAAKLPNAAQELTRPVANPIDMADFMNRRAEARAQERREAPRGEVTDRKQRQAAAEERRPRTDVEAFNAGSRAQSAQRSADRGRGEDDGGRDR